MKCIDCVVADLETALDLHSTMARHGFAKCPKDADPHRFMSLLRDHGCERFSPADPRSTAKRYALLNFSPITTKE